MQKVSWTSKGIAKIKIYCHRKELYTSPHLGGVTLRRWLILLGFKHSGHWTLIIIGQTNSWHPLSGITFCHLCMKGASKITKVLNHSALVPKKGRHQVSKKKDGQASKSILRPQVPKIAEQSREIRPNYSFIFRTRRPEIDCGEYFWVFSTSLIMDEQPQTKIANAAHQGSTNNFSLSADAPLVFFFQFSAQF